MHLINWSYNLMRRNYFSPALRYHLTYNTSRSYYHHPHFMGRFPTAESKVLIRIPWAGPWLLTDLCFCQSPLSTVLTLLLQTSSCLRPFAHTPQACNTLPSKSTWFVPSLPSGPKLLLWLSYIKQLILSLFFIEFINT